MKSISRTRSKPASIVQAVPLEELAPDRTNPRKADQARMALLRLSLQKLGFIMPVYALDGGMLLSGHQRLAAATSLGKKTAACIRVKVKESDIKGINILFNRRLAVDEPVVTPQGLVPIGELQVGDPVCGTDGQTYHVTGKSDVSYRRMYRVALSDGTEVRADGEHLWDVEYTGKSQTTYVGRATLTTLDMRRMLVDERRKLRIPAISPVAGSCTALPVDPWLLGVLLGDGSLDEFGIRLHSSAPQDWLGEKVASAVSSMQVSVVGSPVPGRPSPLSCIAITGGPRGGVMSNELLDCLRSLSLAGTRGHNKFIPEPYLWATAEQRLSLLQGLMDSDGSAAGQTPVFTTTSEALADGVRHLTLSVGGGATKRLMRGAVGNWRSAYQVSVRMPDGVCPFTRPDRVAQFSGATSKVQRRVAQIEEDGFSDAVCISVDSPDHLYLTRNFVPTHNTTNDFSAFDTGLKASERLHYADVLEKAETLPDFEGEDYYALQAREMPIAGLGREHADKYDKKAASMADTLRRMGIRIPLVVSESGSVVNGIHRLFNAKENGETVWPVITIPDAMADLALTFLNYLSMDFHVDEEFAAVLRYSAYRRPQNNRGAVPKAYRFWANGCRTLPDKDSYTADYWRHFRDIHGHNILDFGAGLCKVAPFLTSKGMDCIDFEPYRIDFEKDKGKPCPDLSKAEASRFLDDIADGRRFDSIFLASVLNSVPFARDRMVVLSIVHALSTKDTVVYGTCRDISDFNYEYGGIRNANYFVFDSEPGVRVGDVVKNPKLQKFHTQEEADAMFKRLWNKSEFWPGGNVFYYKLSSPKGINPEVISRALELEFDMPYSDGTTMKLVAKAKEVFGKRLKVKLK